MSNMLSYRYAYIYVEEDKIECILLNGLPIAENGISFLFAPIPNHPSDTTILQFMQKKKLVLVHITDEMIFNTINSN